MNKVILFNPRSAKNKHRVPIGILQVAASIHGKWEYVIVDGNMETDPGAKIEAYLRTGEYKYFGCTVMPGPQLKEAIPITKKIRGQFPNVVTIWGGYFATNQHKVVLDSGYVDYVINGIGDLAFPALLDALDQQKPTIPLISNLIYKQDGHIIKTPKVTLIDMDDLPLLPYDYLNTLYPLKNYLGKTYLGNKTIGYHSSFGCPFTCSFCAVVPIFEARWKGKSASLIYQDIKFLKNKYGVDSVEFFDNNFFVSEKRVVEFCHLIKDENITWWGEGRIDTIDKYSDESLKLMRACGCKMIFFGAESGNDEILKQVDKGGTQSQAQMLNFVKRMKAVGIIPEFSFVLGFPAPTAQKVMQQVNFDINFIKKIKVLNPATEIIIYVYSPVPTEGSEMYEQVKALGFKFPQHLDDWLDDNWQKFDLRRNPLTPWLSPKIVNKILDFELVINARYPTISDLKLTKWQIRLIKLLSSWRYALNIFSYPYEIKLANRFWLKYRMPNTEGAEVIYTSENAE
ncbi:B12-binding domain-containing radical SAM protein [Nubsella zeaxanthinifaciens]|uniref:B12-binding domain-containing radical SAM protein n=1 Tax=Nubsella zeaxanthinifaciens TaxID=392412 RepID=UPI000DE1B8BE|nr:radical SAM protein [Nubsella zeaxanthinifaciens]